jgi:hypothetical protein
MLFEQYIIYTITKTVRLKQFEQYTYTITKPFRLKLFRNGKYKFNNHLASIELDP